MSFDRHVNRRVNVIFLFKIFIISTLASILLYLGLFMVSYGWDYEKAIGDVSIYKILFVPVGITLMFYNVAKGRRNEMAKIDIDKSEYKYKWKRKLKKRNNNIDELLKNGQET